jgi:hypothetical protein
MTPQMLATLRALRDDDPADFAGIFGSFMPEGAEAADLSDAQIEALYVRLTLRYVQALRNRAPFTRTRLSG